MIKSRELKSQDSALNKAADDEPVFVLRSTDKLAPALVRLWSELAALQATCPDEKVEEARELADAMDMWALAHPDRLKWPD